PCLNPGFIATTREPDSRAQAAERRKETSHEGRVRGKVLHERPPAVLLEKLRPGSDLARPRDDAVPKKSPGARRLRSEIGRAACCDQKSQNHAERPALLN